MALLRDTTQRKLPPSTAEARPRSVPGAQEFDPLHLAEAFARAIARPGARAMLIDENNRAQGWRPLTEAARSRRAFAVEVDEAVLAMDADDPDMGHYIESQLAPYIADSGFRPVVMVSGGEGHAISL